jgi:hypothetical protein
MRLSQRSVETDRDAIEPATMPRYLCGALMYRRNSARHRIALDVTIARTRVAAVQVAATG